MMLTQKCQYAMRAVFELAKREGRGPVKINKRDRRGAGHSAAVSGEYPESAPSRRGGRVAPGQGRGLARPARAITAGTIIRLVEGNIYLVECTTAAVDHRCPLHGDCVFLPLWERARQALEAVYDDTTLEDLVRQERDRSERFTPTYCI